MAEQSTDTEELPRPQRPEPAKHPDDDDREATELGAIASRDHYGASEGVRSAVALHRMNTPVGRGIDRDNALKRFWRHQIAVTVPRDDSRDHLGKFGNSCPDAVKLTGLQRWSVHI
jgi:hypothetical protein